MITIDLRLLEEIRDHGREAYPEECCGALLGTGRDGPALVTRVERMRNSRGEERRRRYTIDPLEYVRIERQADEEGIEVLGFYHSHPDHPARPSEYDRERAFPFFHYVVLGVAAGQPGDVGSFVLSEDRGVFEREELSIEAPEGVTHA
ncbi:MAG TPA: M67 family metallopeptidase [Thermoanaerobaculia bacterium]|nr:M67 family metallopeptidase [Thermoanaerobaculia bacterium]